MSPRKQWLTAPAMVLVLGLAAGCGGSDEPTVQATSSAEASMATSSPSASSGAAVDRIDLVTGSKPEGVAAGPQGTLFAGARSDGAIYSADVATGERTQVVPGEMGRAAVGMFFDPRSGLLWVAGGGPLAMTGKGTVTAYDGSEQVYDELVPDAGFLNDLVVTDDAVWVTDSGRASLVRIGLDASGQPAGEPTLVPLMGDYQQPEGFGANGIRELPDGSLVVVSGGVLYRVDLTSGAATVIEQNGMKLSGGDGLILDGQTLYVVNGYGGDEVAVLQLAASYDSTQADGQLTAESLDRPTTAALVGDSLYVVNGRFETLADQPDAEVYLTRLPLS